MEVHRKARKAEIRKAVVEFLSNSSLMEEDNSRQEGGETEGARQQSEGSVEEEVCLQELEIRKLELQYEERQRARDHELEMAKLQRGHQEMGDVAVDNGFMYKARNLIPKFSEQDLDDFLGGFEEVAVAMGWP